MTDSSNLIFRFLRLTQGSWRNAFFVDCINCPYKNCNCDGYLLIADDDGTPLTLPVTYFEKITGDKVDKFECAAIVTKEAFDSLFHQWLIWNVTKPKECSILQLLPKTDNHTL